MEKSKPLNIAVLPGDGIGSEVTQAVLPIFSALNLPVTYTIGDIGWACWEKDKNAIPQQTWDLIKQSDATLLGAITSKPQREASHYISPIIQLRQQLNLYANVRPCFSVKKHQAFNFCIVRENTEGLYSGFDFDHLPAEFKSVVSKNPQWADKMDAPLSCTLRIQSKVGLQKIYNFAFQYALQNNFTRVTLADKPNVLRNSSAFAREIFETIAAQYPHIQADIVNVDCVGMMLVRKPETFGVIVTENMFGDILSDVAAGVMGGLGLAPSANIGQEYCYFEPVHGSAPRMLKDTANPSAMFFSISMLLSHFGYHQPAQIIKSTVTEIIQQQEITTRDLGGSATTQEMANAIIEKAHAKNTI